MKSPDAIWVQVIMNCIKISLVVMTVLFIRQDYPAVLGLLLGTVAAIVKFYLMAGAVTKSIDMSSSKAAAYTYSRYIMRQLFTAGVLIGALLIDGINFFWAVGGILLPQVVIVGGYVFNFLKQSLSSSRKTNENGPT